MGNQSQTLEEQHTQGRCNDVKKMEVGAIEAQGVTLEQVIFSVHSTIEMISVDNLEEDIYQVKSIVWDLTNCLDGIKMKCGKLGVAPRRSSLIAIMFTIWSCKLSLRSSLDLGCSWS